MPKLRQSTTPHQTPQINSSGKKVKSRTKNTIQNIDDILVEKDEVVLVENIILQDDTNNFNSSDQYNFLHNKMNNISTNKKRLSIFLLPWLFMLLLVASSYYLWSQLSDIRKDPLKAAQAEIGEVVKSVGKIMLLPTGETPKMATLTDSDISKVKTQSFFLNAKAGDRLLVYSLARKVILYSPSLNKIIEVANLNSDKALGSSTSL